MVKLALATGAASLATVFVVGALTPGHDMVHGYVSTLSQRDAPLREAYTVGGTLATACGLAFLLRRWPRDRTTLHACGLSLMALFFLLHWIAASFVPCDTDCQWLTATGRLHYAMGFAAFVAVGLGTITLSVHAGRDAKSLHAATAAFVLCAVALLIADRVGRYHGLVERLQVVLLAVWLVALATQPAAKSVPRTERPGITP